MSQPSIATSVALAASYGEPPIVVDLDETLIRTDVLIESFFSCSLLILILHQL
jgi:hypothetical protein